MSRNANVARKTVVKQQLTLKRPIAVIKLKNSPKAKVVIFPLNRAAKSRNKFLSVLQREKLILETRVQARRMARSLLRRWRSRLDVAEVDSVVDLSLCEAASRFDRSRGVSFITFLFYHLRGNLIRLVTEAAQNNRITFVENDNFDIEIEKSGGSQIVSSNEIAAALNSQEQILPDEQVYMKQLSSISKLACDTLDELEKEVISRVFVHEENVYDLANSLGYSRCHISRIKKKALVSLKSELGHVLFEKPPSIAVRMSGKRRPVTRRGARRKEKDLELVSQSKLAIAS